MELYFIEIQKIVMTISSLVQKLKLYNPQQVILFGSQVRGSARDDSDYDVLIIKQTDKRPVERVGEVLKLFDYKTRIDPIVYTPAELEQAKLDNRFFIQHILSEGKVIYEQ